MTTYRDISDTEVAVDAPLTQQLMQSIKDNPKAITEAAVGAPRIELAAMALEIKPWVLLSSGDVPASGYIIDMSISDTTEYDQLKIIMENIEWNQYYANHYFQMGQGSLDTGNSSYSYGWQGAGDNSNSNITIAPSNTTLSHNVSTRFEIDIHHRLHSDSYSMVRIDYDQTLNTLGYAVNGKMVGVHRATSAANTFRYQAVRSNNTFTQTGKWYIYGQSR